jgi:hypothetical protein
VPRAFIKLANVFAGFIGDFISWAGNAVWSLLQIIFEVVAPGAVPYLKKVGAAFRSILKNPIGFVGNLVKAGKQGFLQFSDKFGEYLKAGLIDWLTGSLPGVYIPQSFDLREIITFVLSVLGLTWQNIRQKLVKVVGEPAVAAMETGFDIVVTLVTKGPAAAWDKIKDQIGNLQDMVMGAIMSYVVETVVKKTVAKILSMLVPGGAFVQAIISIYDVIMVFVQKLAKIAQVVMAFLDSIVAIVSGAIAAAAKRVETTLAGLLALAISFLAGFAGLGKIADKVMEIINKNVRAPIDKALDFVIGWIVTMAKKLFAKVFGKKDKDGKADERTDAQKEADVTAAQGDAERLLSDPAVTVDKVGKGLPAIKVKYRLTQIELEPEGDNYDVFVSINPGKRTKKKKIDTSTLAVGDVVRALYKDPRWLDPTREKWIPGTIAAVDQAKKTFKWKSSNLEVPREGTFKFEDQLTKWQKGHVSQIKIPEDEIIELNKKESWPEFGTARVVLNYRHHNSQFNAGGTQWEHIIERSAGGANASGNLALTASTINNRLGVLFGEPYASHEAPSGLPGTNGLPLRTHLAGKSLFIQNLWKQHFYRQLNVSLKWGRSERGVWRELT